MPDARLCSERPSPRTLPSHLAPQVPGALPDAKDRDPQERSQQPLLAEPMERPALQRQVPPSGFKMSFSSERLIFSLSGPYRQAAAGWGGTWSAVTARPAGLPSVLPEASRLGDTMPATGHTVTATRVVG